MLNRNAFIFFIFLFSWGKLGEPESIAQHRHQPCSPPVSIFFLILCFFLFLAVVFTFTKKGLPSSQLCSRASSEGLFSHVFFSALCFYPLKHAPLIFSKEDQAWWFLFVQCGHLQSPSPPGRLVHFCTLHHRLGDQPWGSSQWEWWVNMPPVCPAPLKDVLALLPVDSSADFSMPDVSTPTNVLFCCPSAGASFCFSQ